MTYRNFSRRHERRRLNRSAVNFRYLDNLIHGHEDRIVLTSDIIREYGEWEEYKNGIEIRKDYLLIDGAGHTIDARGNAAIFRFNAKRVAVINAVIKNGRDAISNSGELAFDKCCFLNNKGAISNEGDLRVRNCRFWQNYGDGLAGAIANHGGSLDVMDSVFEANSAKDAGAIYNSGNGFLLGAEFRQNHGEHAGALCNEGDLKILHAKFEKNSSVCEAGAISNRKGDMQVSTSFFGQNLSKKGSGAIFNGGNLSVNGCEFRKNMTRLCGGAIDNAGSLKVSDSMFGDNFSCLRGGAISNNGGTFEVSDSRFLGNRGAIGETIVVSKGDVFKLDNCNLKDDDVAYHETYPYCNFSG